MLVFNMETSVSGVLRASLSPLFTSKSWEVFLDAFVAFQFFLKFEFEDRTSPKRGSFEDLKKNSRDTRN